MKNKIPEFQLLTYLVRILNTDIQSFHHCFPQEMLSLK